MDDILQTLLAGGTPEQIQQVQAEALRGRQTMQAALKTGQKEGSKLDLLNFVAQAAGNNPGLAQGVGALQKTQAARYKPQQLGQSAMLIGDEMVANPEYKEAQEEARQGRLLQTAATLQGKRETAAQRAEQAAQAEAGRNERHAESLALRQTLAAIAGGTRADARAEADAKKREAAVSKDLMKYSTTLNTAGVPEFAEALDIVKGVFTKYTDPKTGKIKDIPGFGRLDSLIPSSVASDETQMVRSNMQGAANILLKSRSGAAVTEPEMHRFLTEVAAGKGMSQAALKNGWDNVEKTFKAKASSLAAGASKDVHEAFIAGGGRDFRKTGAAPMAPKRIKIDVNGNIAE